MVYTSSIFSFFTCLNMGAYSVSKRGLEAFADCLRVEMASFGVKVHTHVFTDAPSHFALFPPADGIPPHLQVSIIQPGNFGRATNIVRMKTAFDIWDKLDEEKKRVFNRQYVELANEYFASICRSGFQNADLVIDAMLHAIVSPRPKHRYLLASAVDRLFFQLVHVLPTAVTDSVFSLSGMYGKRKEMLYNQ